jgi:hypothetical protein
LGGSFLKVEENMRVSTCRREITPDGKYFPCYLMGHAIRTELATGILDKLWTTAIAIDDEGVLLVWVTVELIGLEREYTDRLKKRISEKHHVDRDNINICFVHTHSAPEYQNVSLLGTGGAVPGYMEHVAAQIIDAVDGCFEAEFAEVKAYAKVTPVEGCYGNRNGLDKPCDNDVMTLEFRDGDKVVAGTCCFTCHSTVLGPQNLLVSSDLAGFVARALFDKWKVYPVIMIGAAGDMSNRLFRQGNDETELKRVGTLMMDQVLADNSEMMLEIRKPHIATYRYTRTFYPDKADKKSQYDEIQEKIQNATTFDEKKVYSSALAMARLGLEAKPYQIDLECRYIDMGDLRLFIIPAELFSRFGIRIKEAMECKCPVCWCYSNYSEGYLGNIEDYGASFETASSDIPAGTTEQIVDEMVKFISKMNERWTK